MGIRETALKGARRFEGVFPRRATLALGKGGAGWEPPDGRQCETRADGGGSIEGCSLGAARRQSKSLASREHRT
jgi:hypothetical protein